MRIVMQSPRYRRIGPKRRSSSKRALCCENTWARNSIACSQPLAAASCKHSSHTSRRSSISGTHGRAEPELDLTTDTNTARSYYAASANPAPEHPSLRGDISADVCVIGGGIAGCSTALELAERGYRVVLL